MKYNVITWNPNLNKVEYYDIIPYLTKCLKEEKKRKNKVFCSKIPETFDEMKKFILSVSRYQFWSRCEYEVIIQDWPCQSHSQKIDAYQQIEANIDAITLLFMSLIG